MSEEFEIENFEELMNVFENTGDFGKYYLGNYSNIQIANYLRKIEQENKQLKEKIKKAIKCIKNQYYEKEYRTKGTFVNKLMVILGDKE